MRNKKGRIGFLLLLFSVLIVLTALQAPGYCAGYPEKTIECAIPWTPGSASDIGIRMICKFAEKELGVAIAPINMVGGNGAVAWEHIYKAKPQGYTISLVTFDILTNQIMGSELKYDSLFYVLQFTRQPLGLYVHSDSPYKTVKEFVNAAKENPGKITCGTTSLGGLLHQAGFLFQDHYGIQLNYVPFKGSSIVMSQLLGKHIDSGVNTITKMAPHVESGTMRMLMEFSDVTLPSYPNVPNIKELGISEVGFESWRAVALPKGVAENRKNILKDAFTRPIITQSFRPWLRNRNFIWCTVIIARF